ncbi:type II toxin-antitoxin system HipA family toxin [Pusillimonas sp. ANT_WB101]|uniref:type II toxin-antitoxin system HipA family toxin n=1 Tax=Pusillimonas sp. ANT_WB101 TaxID=2597356 RepID=UPI002107EE7D|nr:type II toxin-antitoxin system HipA family toxin [Pusillimonas sp. ANT_WB101]
MMTSNRYYIYLEHPESGKWVTVGRYSVEAEQRVGQFIYAKSYLQSDAPISIDPVNLPLLNMPFASERYGGLHDVLRDACPDSWGRALLQREHGLSDQSPHVSFLLKANNADRWGALAIGTSKTPSVSHLASPKLPQLDVLASELLAMSQRLPPVDARLRRRLMATPSLGGARPKATVQDGNDFWLIKPVLPSDVLDVPMLEHAMAQWARVAGLRFATTRHDSVAQVKGTGISVLRSLRFDRKNGRRLMTLSGATMLQTQYPNAAPEDQLRWSYPRLANTLAKMNVPPEDQLELFDRMVFNALIGNDDDHPRNHSAVYVPKEGTWRLAPAYDVVPELQFIPKRLSMMLSQGCFEISRESVLSDAMKFGFDSQQLAQVHLDALLVNLVDTFESIEPLLTDAMREMMIDRIAHNMKILGPIAS